MRKELCEYHVIATPMILAIITIQHHHRGKIDRQSFPSLSLTPSSPLSPCHHHLHLTSTIISWPSPSPSAAGHHHRHRQLAITITISSWPSASALTIRERRDQKHDGIAAVPCAVLADDTLPFVTKLSARTQSCYS